MENGTAQIPVEEARKIPRVIELAVWYRDAVLHNDQTAINFFYEKAPKLRTIPVLDPKYRVYYPEVMNALQRLKPSDLVLLRRELEDRGKPWLTPEVKGLQDKIAPRREL